MPYQLCTVELHIGSLKKLVISLGDDDDDRREPDKTLLLYEIVVNKSTERDAQATLTLPVTEEQADRLLKIEALLKR